jgi:hypothetical protein
MADISENTAGLVASAAKAECTMTDNANIKLVITRVLILSQPFIVYDYLKSSISLLLMQNLNSCQCPIGRSSELLARFLFDVCCGRLRGVRNRMPAPRPDCDRGILEWCYWRDVLRYVRHRYRPRQSVALQGMSDWRDALCRVRTPSRRQMRLSAVALAKADTRRITHKSKAIPS